MKNLIRKLLGLFFFYSGLVWLKLMLEKKNYLLILFGHKITTDQIGFFAGVHPQQLGRVVAYLTKHFKFVNIDEANNLLSSTSRPLQDRYIALTFDDGFRDNYVHGFPIFLKYNVYATIYLVYNCIEDKRLPWAQRLGYIFQHTKLPILQWTYHDISIDQELTNNHARYEVFIRIKQWLSKMDGETRNKVIENLERTCTVQPLQDQMLSWEQVLEMQARGCYFGSHTMNHSILKNLPEEKALDEMTASKTKIEEKLNRKADHFAFPAGSYSDRLLEAVSRIGYKTCFTRSERFDFKIYPGADPYRLVRLGIANEPHYVILSEVAGMYNFFRKLF
jgi:peptidoglycan/xylan/chitin deacetylase (PgdA/CDA1 family)